MSDSCLDLSYEAWLACRAEEQLEQLMTYDPLGGAGGLILVGTAAFLAPPLLRWLGQLLGDAFNKNPASSAASLWVLQRRLRQATRCLHQMAARLPENSKAKHILKLAVGGLQLVLQGPELAQEAISLPFQQASLALLPGSRGHQAYRRTQLQELLLELESLHGHADQEAVALQGAVDAVGQALMQLNLKVKQEPLDQVVVKTENVKSETGGQGGAGSSTEDSLSPTAPKSDGIQDSLKQPTSPESKDALNADIAIKNKVPLLEDKFSYKRWAASQPVVGQINSKDPLYMPTIKEEKDNNVQPKKQSLVEEKEEKKLPDANVVKEEKKLPDANVVKEEGEDNDTDSYQSLDVISDV